jgi:hypothetical protein
MAVSSGQRGSPNLPRAVALAVVMALGFACGTDGATDLGSFEGIDLSEAQQFSFPAWPEVQHVTGMERLPGERAAGPELLFHGIRDVHVSDDGTFYVAHGGSHEVVALDPGGPVLWRAGREGEGPGEFQVMGGVQGWTGDTLVILDGVRPRASFLTSSGEFSRVASAVPEVPEPEWPVALLVPARPIGVAPDGRILFEGPTRVPREGSPGLRRGRTPLTLVPPSPDGSGPEVVADLPGIRAYELRTPQVFAAILAPMSVTSPLAVSREGIAWARADAFQVILFDFGGRGLRVFSVDEGLDPVTPELRADYLEEAWRPWFQVDGPVPFPSHVPAFDRVFLSWEGDVWARRFHWGERAQVWARFSAEGGGLDVYRLPTGVTVMAAAGGLAYGVYRDEMDVEHLVRIPL